MNKYPTKVKAEVLSVSRANSSKMSYYVIILIVIVLTISACTSIPAGPSGYLTILPGGTIFIEFTSSNNHITGNVQVAQLSSDGSQVESTTGSISGTISGSAVTINDENAVLTSNGGNISGIIQGSDLVLSFPEQNGQLKPVRFIHATMLDYNATVAKLQHEANQTAAAQAAAQNAAAVQARKQ